MSDTTTRLTGLTPAQVAEIMRACADAGIVPITGTTIATVPLSAPALLQLLHRHKIGILGSAPERDHHTGESRRGRATATSSVIRKLRRYLDPVTS